MDNHHSPFKLDATTVPPFETAEMPEPTQLTEGQLLANAEYARVQYEMFQAKIKAGLSGPSSTRGRRLFVAAKQARVIYHAASKAASDYVAQS